MTCFDIILKTDVNVSTVSYKQKSLFFVGILKAKDKSYGSGRIRNPLYGSKDTDPSQKAKNSS
jgi:hypothetical protein